jgi:hypothetical protein
MTPSTRRTITSLFTTSVFILAATQFPDAQATDAVIIKCGSSCDAVVAAVTSAGGEITHTYQNIAAVAARVPRGGMPAVVTLTGAEAIRKDVIVRSPAPKVMVEATGRLSQDAIVSSSDGEIQPLNYNYNLDLTNVAPLHAAGHRGQAVVVAVIDSGTANVAQIPALAGSVIGGETFVPLAQDPLSATHRENGSHGTMTAEMVAAHAVFLFASSSPLVAALNLYAPGSAISCTAYPGNCGLPPAVAAAATAVPMTGTAPAAKIYAMKVFPATGGGAPESRVIAAMDRAITLRRNFNTTGQNTVASGSGTETDPFVYSSLKIDVVNMSLSGPTLFAGRDLEDLLTVAMLDVGITPVTAAGNEGFAAMTGGSPGTGPGGLTVGAASTSVHERILADLQFGPGVGAIYRPTTHVQTAYFSSRGPTAEGRLDPELVANGDFSYVHAYLALTAGGGLVDCREPAAVPGTCVPRIVFASGTSFSAPTVAGGAAVLYGSHPEASATEIRNALHESANPNLLGDDSTAIDQGRGFLDVSAADELLTAGNVSARAPHFDAPVADDEEDELGGGGKSVIKNVVNAGLSIARFRNDRYSIRLENLKPGEVAQIFVPSDAATSKLVVAIDEITPELPPSQQNQFYGRDDIFFMIVDAPTSLPVFRGAGFVPNSNAKAAKVTIDHPQTGLVRVAIQGDWVNAGEISATVTVTRRRNNQQPSASSVIEQDEIEFIEFDIPDGTSKGVFELAWKQNWARYPTNDIDLVLIDPAGDVNAAGATANSPERVEISDPQAGRWTAAIIGFNVHGKAGGGKRTDAYTVRVAADGRRLRPVQ